MRTIRLAALLATIMAVRLDAQLPAPATEMLRRIYASRDFSGQRFGPARWIEGGNAYTTLEPSPGARGAFEIVRYATATGARSVLVSAQQLTPQGRNAPLDMDDYAWSDDGSKLLIFTNT